MWKGRGRASRALAAVATALTALAMVLVTQTAAQAQPLPDREIVAVTGTDGQLWVSYTGGSSWQPLGGRLIDAPVVVRGAYEVYFVGLGADHNVWIRTPDQAWRPYGPEGTWCEGPGAAAVSNTFAVVCRGADGAAWIATTQLPLAPDVVPTARGAASTGWRSLGGVIQYGAAVGAWQPGSQQPVVAVVAVGADNRPYWSRDGGNWQLFSSETCGGPISASPELAALACRMPDGQVRLFRTGEGGVPSVLGGQITGRPGVAAFADGQADVFALGTDGQVWLTRERPNGSQDAWAPLNAYGLHGLSAIAPRG